ncbi:MAG: PQQ-binding-like beta-propeller repeat protein [Phycisphaerae bacterium]|jgi:outer membrane protein assembly factor BamB|nr:PQQ-binding-like beta-propeller repeat protein [Phycisphaerae bacterium]
MTAKRISIQYRLIGAVVIVVTIAVGLRVSEAQRLMGRTISRPVSTSGKPPALVNADDELASYLVGARKSIKDGNYDRAIEVLQALIDKADSGFVADADGKQYVALWQRANETLAGMGPEGLELYRRLYDPQAEKLFQQAASTQDSSALRRLTQQFLHTAYGYKALRRLGDIHFDRGHFARAAMYWRRALRLKVASNQRALMLAKIASALHLAGDAAGSKSAGDELRKAHRGATGVMSGKKQDLAAFVEKIRKIPIPDIASRRHQAGKEWRGLGAFPDGMAVMGDCDVVLTPSWRLPGDVPIGPVDIRGKMIAMQSLLTNYSGGSYTMIPKPRKGHVYVNYVRRGMGTSTTGFFMPSGIQPVVVGNLVLCRLDDGVAAYNIDTGADKTGKPVWSTRFSPIYRKGSTSGVMYYSGTMQKVSDNGRYAMTVDGDRVYLLANFVPKKWSRSSRVVSGGNQRDNTSVLQALSISRSGRLMWQSDDSSVNSDEALLGGKFISVPTVCNGRLYSLVAFRTTYYLVCLAADTGKLIWRASISQVPAMTQSYQRYNQHLLVRGSPVAVAEGMAFVATNAGVVAAFEAESGAAVWAYQYDSKINKAMSRYGSRIQLTGQPSVNPIIVTRGKVIALPIDSEKVLMLSSIDGKPTGASPDRQGHCDFSAIDADRVLLSGPGLIVLSTATGKELHRISDAGIVGRPAVSADSVLASGQGQLVRMNLKDYSRSTRVFTNSDCLLGNLVCVDGKLIAANSAGVCVYLSYKDSIASLTKRIERQEGFAKLNLTFDRGQLSFNSREFAGALADFKTTLAGARKGGYTAVDMQVKHWLYRTHVAIGNAAKTADKMQQHFEDAQAVARTLGGDSGAQYILRCTMRLAKVMEQRAIEYQAAAAVKLTAGDKTAAIKLEGKRHAILEEAVKLARKIAETYAEKRVPDIRVGAEADNRVRDTEDTPLMLAGVWAQQKFIPRIIRTHGRKCYSAFDGKAGEMLQRAIADNDSDAMLEVSKRWPNSLWAAQAMYEAGTSLYAKTRDGGDAEDYPAMSQAAWRMAVAAKMTDDPMLAVASLAGRATIYHRMGMTNCARSICRDMRKLCRAKGITLSETIEFAGKENRVIEFLRKFEGDKPLPLDAVGSSESLVAPLTEAFGIKGTDIFIVRDQEYQPIRQGGNVLLLNAGKAVWFNTAAKSAEDAILWQSGAPVVAMDQIRNYMTAPGYGIIAGFSADAKTVALADRGSGTATGFDIATGKVRWRGTFAQWGITSVSYMAGGDGVLVITDSGGKVACVSLTDGKIRWMNKLVGGSRAPVGPARIARGVVMIKSNSYKMLTCFDSAGGRVLWKWAGNSSAEGRTTDEGLILALVDGVVSLHDPARMSHPLWVSKYDSSAKPILLTASGGQLFISEGIYSPWIEVVSMSSGNRLARVKIESFNGAKTSITGAVARSGDLYVTFGGIVSGDRNRRFGRQTMIRGLGIQKIDLGDGRVVWRNELGAANYYFNTLPLIVTGRTVVAAPKDTQQTIPRKIFLIGAEKGLNLQSIEVYKGLTGIMKQGDRVRLGALFQPVLIKGRLLVETFGGLGVYKQK